MAARARLSPRKDVRELVKRVAAGGHRLHVQPGRHVKAYHRETGRMVSIPTTPSPASLRSTEAWLRREGFLAG